MKLPSNSVTLSSEEMMYVNGGGWSFKKFKKKISKLVKRLPFSPAKMIHKLVSKHRNHFDLISKLLGYGAQAYSLINSASSSLLASSFGALR